MIQITLNIPTEKLQNLLNALAQSHLSNSINNIIVDNKHLMLNPIFINHQLPTQHPYFDAEFYTNEIFE